MAVRFFVCLAVLLGLWSAPLHAQEDAAGIESAALDSILVYCLAPVFARENPAALAADIGLELLQDDIAAQFTRGAGVAYALPLAQESAILVVRNTNMCSVYVRAVNRARFLTLAGEMLLAQGPFKVKEERRTAIATHLFYEADLDGILGVMISVEDSARPERPQVLFSVARYRAEDVAE